MAALKKALYGLYDLISAALQKFPPRIKLAVKTIFEVPLNIFRLEDLILPL